jgi:K+-transporting ATPase ATPase C chain
MTFLTGIAYPLAVVGLAEAIFPLPAGGSLVYKNGEPVGSALIGQKFTSPAYFHGRPSAAGQSGYDAASSGGSNLGPTNRKLISTAQERIALVQKENGLKPQTPVPGDLVTASASGLDPHISPEAAFLQVPRVAGTRNLPEEEVRELVERRIERPQLGILGAPRVNVLLLNLALDELTQEHQGSVLKSENR